VGQIDDIANVSITKETVYPTRAGFSIPLFVVLHSFWVPLVRLISQLSELTALNVPNYHPLYLGVQAALNQNPRPPGILVGRRTRAYTQVIEIRPLTTTEGFVYSFTIVDSAGVETAISYTVLAAETTTTVAAALELLIEAVTDVTSTAALGVITATTTAGKVTRYKDLPLLRHMTLKNVSTDPGLDDDLDDIEQAIQESESSAYGLAVDEAPEAAINSTALWAQSRKMLFVPRTSDGQCADSGVTDDICSDIQDAAYSRTGIMFAGKDTHDYRDMALLGAMLPKEPGSATFALKTLNGITRDVLSSDEYSALQAKGATTYTRVNGKNITFEGHTGDGDYLDNTLSLDFLHARIQEDVFGALVVNDRLPYTQPGIEILTGVVQNRLDKSTSNPNPILDPAGPLPPTATAPKIEDTDTSDRATRTLREIPFVGRLQGAIHKATIRGRVTV
jgi:hypothetical protein